MKKFKYFLWTDPCKGSGIGETICYIKANSRERAKEKLLEVGFKHDPDFINGDVTEVKEFTQPTPIPIL